MECVLSWADLSGILRLEGFHTSTFRHLKANKWTCYFLTEEGRRQEASWSEPATSRSFVFSPAFQAHRGDVKAGKVTLCTRWALHRRWGNPCPSKGDFSKPAGPLPCRETLSSITIIPGQEANVFSVMKGNSIALFHGLLIFYFLRRTDLFTTPSGQQAGHSDSTTCHPKAMRLTNMLIKGDGRHEDMLQRPVNRQNRASLESLVTYGHMQESVSQGTVSEACFSD